MESPAAANATERERELECALAKMWFAYANKDADNPHDFEKTAIEEAKRLLGPWNECMPKYFGRPDEILPLFCKYQSCDSKGVFCTAYLAEGRAMACPYANQREPVDREKYHCDFTPRTE